MTYLVPCFVVKYLYSLLYYYIFILGSKLRITLSTERIHVPSHLHFLNFQNSRRAMALEATSQSLDPFQLSENILDLDVYFPKTKCLVIIINKFLNLTNFLYKFRRKIMLYLVVGMYKIEPSLRWNYFEVKKNSVVSITEPLERRHKDKPSHYPHLYFCQHQLFQE